jgi:hypothetical protein
MKRWVWMGALLLAAGLNAGGKVQIRKAEGKDVDAMVALSAAKRVEYAKAQPIFHKIAPDADAKQKAFLSSQLDKADQCFLVHSEGGTLDAWINGRLVSAPPVYEPGGRVLLVDDFCVAKPELWASAGKALLLEAKAWAKGQGAVLVNVVCGPEDAPKRALLKELGLGVASEWHVGKL